MELFVHFVFPFYEINYLFKQDFFVEIFIRVLGIEISKFKLSLTTF